nr:hypothetical protein [Tanacetum cinerariifolium]
APDRRGAGDADRLVPARRHRGVPEFRAHGPALSRDRGAAGRGTREAGYTAYQRHVLHRLSRAAVDRGGVGLTGQRGTRWT